MDDSETRTMLSFGRAYRLLEAWVEADLMESTRKAIFAAFGGSLEFRMVETLAKAQEALQLSEIAARSGASRREISRQGHLRHSLTKMERSGVVINVGTLHRPLYQLNLFSDEAKPLISLFARDGTPALKPVRSSV